MKSANPSTSHASTHGHAHASASSTAAPDAATLPPEVAANPAPAPVPTTPISSAPTPLASRIAQATALVKQAGLLLGLDQRPVRTVEQVRRTAKFRKGGEAFLPLLAQASQRFNVSVPSKPTSSMVDAVNEAAELDPLRTAVGELTKSLDDWYQSDRSEAWSIATTLYSMLKKAALREPKLAELLVPLKDFFSYRHPSVVAQKPKRSDTKAVTQAQTKAQKVATKLKGRVDKIEAVLPAGAAKEDGTPVPSPVAAAPAAVKAS